jgi:hypothetical protein
MKKINFDASRREEIYIPLTETELAAMQPTPYQLACEAWGNMTFAKKVIAAFELQFEYPQIISYAIINPDLMAIEKKADGLHVYYNELHPNHLPLVQSIGLTELEIPKEEDYV